jgi:alcohol dehydrogenase
LQKGQTVLIHAGAGGVGTFAIQLAKSLGARVATTASAKNHPLLKSLGADLCIDYKSTRFEDAIHDVDVVFDTQGGETLLRSFAVVRSGGTVVTVGGKPDGKFAKSWGLPLPMQWILALLARPISARAMKKNARFEYLFMRASGEQLAEIAKLVEGGAIRPVLDKTYPLDQAKEALAYVESAKGNSGAVGKVIVVP